MLPSLPTQLKLTVDDLPEIEKRLDRIREERATARTVENQNSQQAAASSFQENSSGIPRTPQGQQPQLPLSRN
uniref:Uncharacterized protein n=1 Tax=Chromera velia CCMP2878 TaxID=1169474 RepID=A0A0G4HT11_9ALVE|eukprot:Cvel_8348.t1-p1 / transcript=Cvel_8348.t1 / gene=Cvel_8348 / organism=Chromera_velia_CCMP2878 / gene_product=hypothetical protein / transcript_product=hypothetical protein / location=Cvel_scaffold459:69437-70187(-) / protein_length=72 / sequence_SO=supercontig / SO=protein_coding / is_pseudo=false